MAEYHLARYNNYITFAFNIKHILVTQKYQKMYNDALPSFFSLSNPKPQCTHTYLFYLDSLLLEYTLIYLDLVLGPHVTTIAEIHKISHKPHILFFI